jgi:hypothetical protein
MISQRGSNDLHQKTKTFELCTSNYGQVTWIVEYGMYFIIMGRTYTTVEGSVGIMALATSVIQTNFWAELIFIQ